MNGSKRRRKHSNSGNGVDGAEDWLEGADEGAKFSKLLEDRRKELRVEMREDEKRRRELTKTTSTGKPAKDSIGWMRAQGMQVREFEAELFDIQSRLAPLVEEIEAIDLMLAPYEAIKEKMKIARARLRDLKTAFAERLSVARADLDDDACRELVLDIDQERLLERLERTRVRGVGMLVADFERLWDKYWTSMTQIEGRRDTSTALLRTYIKELGYA